MTRVASLRLSRLSRTDWGLDTGPANDWRWSAECLGSGELDALFFSEQGGHADQARRICRRCDVRAECLSYALDTRQEHGIWGGLTREERRQVLRCRERRCEHPEHRS